MKLTLKQKLIGASLSAVVLMAGALTWLSASQIRTQTMHDIEQRAHAVSATSVKGIADWVAQRRLVTKTVNQYTTEQNIEPYLQQAANGGGIYEMYFGTEQGNMYRSNPAHNKAGYDPRVRGWYKSARTANQQIITPAYRGSSSQAMMITIAQPVQHAGQFVGVVGADILIEQLVEGVINIKAGQNAQAMLIDGQNGTLLAHANKSLLLKPLHSFSNDLSLSAVEAAADSHQLMETSINGADKFFYFARVEGSPWIFGLELDRDSEFAAQSTLMTRLIIASIVVTLIVIVAASWLVSYLTSDLMRVSRALEEIANGEGDLTQRLRPHSDDEVGKLAENFNTFVSHMHDMVSKLSRVSSSLSQQANTTAEHAGDRSARIQVQQDEINMVATAINQMAAATQEIAGNADNTATHANEAVSAAIDGTAQVTQTKNSIESLAHEVLEAAQVIKELETHTNSISTILSTIQDISEQTNLLALNAAIEAARAGEQGRGFAVVADEVRVLSQRTNTSTKEIQTMIDTLQATTTRAVSMINDSQSLSDTSVQDAVAAAASLTQIQQAVENISDMATQIASAAEEQASVTSEITRNTEGIRDVSDALSSEAHEASQQASDLSELSQQLDGEIRQFKL
ncbi:methyl-accepting chemotaxis protein [Vibrio nitrifigilis]|uniref:Methyl-accepting chemotaxis protein n=1 Tax=Vibrio nitrifigilis TaxID=2789781 RepID=A0ABS0GE06_9VIBR|nr:methyl-accepting chemotaxis protein [Vibrio nitrifigilis]MBF9000659.1 methyl-accepting chemotaxis protein [Vibrio nitrifigilis]